jgi:TM2 domain-containing membrane protein YozV
MSQSATGAGTASPKSVGVAYVLWFFLGVLGVHQFYLGRVGRGVSYIFTLGWLAVGLIIDLFTLPSQVRTVNAANGLGLERKVGSTIEGSPDSASIVGPD